MTRQAHQYLRIKAVVHFTRYLDRGISCINKGTYRAGDLARSCLTRPQIDFIDADFPELWASILHSKHFGALDLASTLIWGAERKEAAEGGSGVVVEGYQGILDHILQF